MEREQTFNVSNIDFGVTIKISHNANQVTIKELNPEVEPSFNNQFYNTQIYNSNYPMANKPLTRTISEDIEMAEQIVIHSWQRFRNIYLVIGSVFVIALWIVTDPDAGFITSLPVGAGTLATIVVLLKSVLYVGILHLSRKAVCDYVNLKTVIDKATSTPEGAGYVVMAIGLIMISISITIFAATSS